jgi:hypothetical protein
LLIFALYIWVKRQYIFKSGRVVFFLKINVSIHDHLWFLLHFRIFFSIFVKIENLDTVRDFIESTEHFGYLQIHFFSVSILPDSNRKR